MRHRIEAPFDSIENAQDYLKLLSETVAEAQRDIANEVALAQNRPSPRRVEALRIVEYNLEKLQRYLSGSGRTLNDLRSLRRLLLEGQPSPKANEANDTKEAKPQPAGHTPPRHVARPAVLDLCPPAIPRPATAL